MKRAEAAVNGQGYDKTNLYYIYNFFTYDL